MSTAFSFHQQTPVSGKNVKTSFSLIAEIVCLFLFVLATFRNGAGMMKCREMMARKALLPVLDRPLKDECRSHSANMHCFKGGDSRTNEQPGIYLLFIGSRRILFNVSFVNKQVWLPCIRPGCANIIASLGNSPN